MDNFVNEEDIIYEEDFNKEVICKIMNIYKVNLVIKYCNIKCSYFRKFE